MSESKTVLVTGASRGIGKAILSKFINLGYAVVGTATTEAGAQKITELIASLQGKGGGIALDVTSEASIAAAMPTITAKFGSPSILVNNAGITADGLFLRMAEDSFDKVLQANLYGPFRLIKECVKSMIKSRWGRIINITSVVAFSGNVGQVNYCSAKSGLLGLSRSLARELATRNITVNLVAPGFIATDMTDNIPQEHRERLIKDIPMGRIGSSDDVANAVAFLASDGASYITGNTIHVNGGMLMG